MRFFFSMNTVLLAINWVDFGKGFVESLLAVGALYGIYYLIQKWRKR